ncbi:S-layer homology domain-containing protein [Lentibacillus persicus]|uniref:S-layer homology domain-containing protein n=1 Tax=Lentibacillus persicus TaxID=640948 RepID=A0A1I1VZH3_9BACI|nr:S-layer homology domain-containing protein [Lentibacillus persicus]SFD86473.1 S-layer homology domain-containing protein [Lentibacillus persicus]
MQKKTFRRAAISTMAASATVAAVAPAVAAEEVSFTDVTPDHTHYDNILAMAEQGVIQGYQDGTFKPYESITRGQVAAMLTNALNLDVPEDLDSALEGYSDVDSSNDYAEAIAAVTEAGIFKGNDGEFGEYDNISREQMATVLVEGFGLNDYDKGDDVELNKDHISKSHVDNVQTLANLGITKALNEYHAYQDIQRDQFTTMVKLTKDVLENETPISEVVPEDISISTNSVQAVVGEEVTVRAQVAVEDGESAAGIPVTFNIDANESDYDNQDQTVEVYTDEDGVASYSYTQYSGGEDRVVAYATNDTTVRANDGMVYWGVKDRLTIEEITEDNTLANGAKKVYKVKQTTTDGDPASGWVNVAFAENVEVDADELVRGVEITDASGEFLVEDEVVVDEADYPYQLKNGGEKWVRVLLDEDGEATFTLTGEDASVTPIVFDDGHLKDGDEDESAQWSGDDRLNTTELQAQASTVSFEYQQNREVEVEAEGTQYAAAISAGGEGGRDYKATIRKENGDLAPEGTEVKVALDDSNGDVTLVDSAGDETPFASNDYAELTTNEDGVIEFTLIGESTTGDYDAYAVPTVFIENGSEDGLDDRDAQATGEIVYFVEPVLEEATLKVYEAGTDNQVEALEHDEANAEFVYQVVDQNNKPHNATSHTATFEVKNTGFNNIVVKGQTITPGNTESFDVTANDDGSAELEVDGLGVTSAEVNVSSSQYTLDNSTASVDFTADTGNLIPSTYTGTFGDDETVESNVNTGSNQIKFDEFDTANYDPSELYFNGDLLDVNGNVDEDKFFGEIEDIVEAGGTVEITANKQSDGTYSLTVVGVDEGEAPEGPAAVEVNSPNDEEVTSEDTIDIEGISEANTTVYVFDDENGNGEYDEDEEVGTPKAVNASGVFNITATLNENTQNDFLVVAENTEGGFSTAVEVPTITHDTLAPLVTGATLSAGDDTFGEVVIDPENNEITIALDSSDSSDETVTGVLNFNEEGNVTNENAFPGATDFDFGENSSFEYDFAGNPSLDDLKNYIANNGSVSSDIEVEDEQGNSTTYNVRITYTINQ